MSFIRVKHRDEWQGYISKPSEDGLNIMIRCEVKAVPAYPNGKGLQIERVLR